MNTPNKLTLCRVGLIPFFVGFLFADSFTDRPVVIACCRWAALAVFVAAAVTDYLDGAIARRYNQVTNFGKLFDPLADKLLTMAAFVAFVELQVPSNRPIFPAWAIIVILAREFLVTGLRSVASAQGKIIHADRWGKHKTVWQLVGIITVLLIICMHDTLPLLQCSRTEFDRWLPVVYNTILCVVIAFTVLSGIAYLRKNWDLISDNV